MLRVFSALFFFFLATIFCAAERVVNVSDGDTITVLDAENRQFRVRLWGIDAPEKKQAFGDLARRVLSAEVAGKDVRLDVRGKDRYGRVLAKVFLDDKDICMALVGNGYAWHHVQYAKKAGDLAAAERHAREHRLGLWGGDNPIPPWEFRKLKRKR